MDPGPCTDCVRCFVETVNTDKALGPQGQPLGVRWGTAFPAAGEHGQAPPETCNRPYKHPSNCNHTESVF